MNLSRGLFAGYLRTNVRTLENWEQGRAKPNAQAALLIRMVQRYPDTSDGWPSSAEGPEVLLPPSEASSLVRTAVPLGPSSC